tara:strand:- start:74 stop:415 length:342 start_codon:yes stop_codon:yes gene_type:complete
MNPITDILFTISWFILLFWAIRTMIRGWNLMNQPIEKSDVNGVYTKTVTKPIHPEMVDVKPGEELMGITFKQDSQDPLYKSMQDRIDTLREEEGTYDVEDDDEDDDGDVIVRV